MDDRVLEAYCLEENLDEKKRGASPRLDKRQRSAKRQAVVNDTRRDENNQFGLLILFKSSLK